MTSNDSKVNYNKPNVAPKPTAPQEPTENETVPPTLQNQATQEQTAEQRALVTNCPAVYVRLRPTTESKFVAILENRHEVILLENSEEGWTRIKTELGVVGYIMSEYLEVL